MGVAAVKPRGAGFGVKAEPRLVDPLISHARARSEPQAQTRNQIAFHARIAVAIEARREKVIVFPFEEPVVLRFVLSKPVHLLSAVDIPCVKRQTISLAAPDEVGTGIQ